MLSFCAEGRGCETDSRGPSIINEFPHQVETALESQSDSITVHERTEAVGAKAHGFNSPVKEKKPSWYHLEDRLAAAESRLRGSTEHEAHKQSLLREQLADHVKNRYKKQHEDHAISMFMCASHRDRTKARRDEEIYGMDAEQQHISEAHMGWKKLLTEDLGCSGWVASGGLESAQGRESRFPGKMDPFSCEVHMPIVWPDFEAHREAAGGKEGDDGDGDNYVWGWSYHTALGVTLTRIVMLIALMLVPSLIYGFLRTDPTCNVNAWPFCNPLSITTIKRVGDEIDAPLTIQYLIVALNKLNVTGDVPSMPACNDPASCDHYDVLLANTLVAHHQLPLVNSSVVNLYVTHRFCDSFTAMRCVLTQIPMVPCSTVKEHYLAKVSSCVGRTCRKVAPILLQSPYTLCLDPLRRYVFNGEGNQPHGPLTVNSQGTVLRLTLGKCVAGQAGTGSCVSDNEMNENLKHLQLGVWSLDTQPKQSSAYGRGTWLDDPSYSLTTHIGTSLPGFMKHVFMEMSVEQVEIKKFPNNGEGEKKAFVATHSMSEKVYHQNARPAQACDDPDLRALGMTRDSCVIVWDIFQYIVENQVTASHKGLVEWFATIGGLLSVLGGIGKVAHWLNKRSYRHVFEQAHGKDWARRQWLEQEETHFYNAVLRESRQRDEELRRASSGLTTAETMRRSPDGGASTPTQTERDASEDSKNV